MRNASWKSQSAFPLFGVSREMADEHNDEHMIPNKYGQYINYVTMLQEWLVSPHKQHRFFFSHSVGPFFSQRFYIQSWSVCLNRCQKAAADRMWASWKTTPNGGRKHMKSSNCLENIVYNPVLFLLLLTLLNMNLSDISFCFFFILISDVFDSNGNCFHIWHFQAIL